MANICSNEIRVWYDGEDRNGVVEKIKDFLEDNFDTNIMDYVEESELTAYFDSKWTFPEDFFGKLAEEIGEDNNLCCTILSTEWGNLYTMFFSWTGEQFSPC